MKKTICFDFDGVINSYKSGWCGEDNIPDPPVDGIAEVIRTLSDMGYEIAIYSTRLKSWKGTLAVANYIDKMGISQYVKKFSCEKPPAVAYVDDRAICFDGNTDGLVEKITSFKSWVEVENASE